MKRRRVTKPKPKPNKVRAGDTHDQHNTVRHSRTGHNSRERVLNSLYPPIARPPTPCLFFALAPIRRCMIAFLV